MSDAMRNLEPSDFLDFSEALALLGVSRPTLYRWIRERRVKAFKAGKQWRFIRRDVIGLLEERSHATDRDMAELQALADGLQRILQSGDDGAEPLPRNPEEAADELADRLLVGSIRGRASDIHLDPTETGGLTLRLRIDGVLHRVGEIGTTPAGLLLRSIAEHGGGIETVEQLGQGRFPIDVDDRTATVRFTSLCAFGGTKLTLRLLDPGRITFDPELLFPDPSDRQAFDQLAGLAWGLVLISGPTGSGKTTTAYSLLSRLAEKDCAVYSIESPVEVALPGVIQVQAECETNKLSFAATVRRVTYADPDVVFVGDVPDTATARQICKLAGAGHLTFVQLAATSATDAIAQFVKLTGDPRLVASCLVGATNQRLVRRACPDCATSEPMDPRCREDLGLTEEHEGNTAVIEGCERCVAGYRGRLPVYEVLRTDEHLLDLVASGKPEAELRSAARKAGVQGLREKARWLLETSQTTVEEVLRVTPKG